MSSFLTSLFLYCLINSVQSSSKNQTETINTLNIDINYEENDTIVLLYNLTTKYSHYITFRAFGDVQFQFGLFSSTNKSEKNSLEIAHHYSSSEPYYLFIVCFHFLQFNDLDIQCRDIRLLNVRQLESNASKEFLPSYNPLFVPMMYALSVVMLLPVIVQHHRHKKALLLQRRQTLRRLSMQIADDDQIPQQNLLKNILLQIKDDGNTNYENLCLEMDTISDSVPKVNRNDLSDNNVTFTLENLQPLIHRRDGNDIDEQVDVNADDCVAHLLNNTPWNSSQTEQPLSTNLSRHAFIHDWTTATKEQNVPPTVISFHDDDDDDSDQRPILKPNKQASRASYKSNRVFFETDV
ncbi:unnamed protein product [Adineta ricciae]|uniref:Uncharacterized protein n=1 Tax=Adineta ricciae TaxID=249248 RepID=A0A814CIR5_ADIRI|nr:unnamed protein product [Adineta ricciae]CAF1052435.1 unnamed protein product [Adineta ricciae]